MESWSLKSIYKIVILVSIVSGSLSSIITVPELPSYFKICHQRDPNFNECIKASINTIVKQFQNGSKELDMKPIDPYDIPLLDIKEGTGQDNVTLWMTLKHSRLLGLSNTTVISVKSNVLDNKLEIVTRWPFLDIIGEFTSDGAVLTFPLSADGSYSINMSDVTAIWIMYYARPKINGHRFLAIDELDVDVIPSSLSYHFGDVLDGDPTLGRAMNDFINENSYEIFTFIKPKIRRMFKEIFGRVASQIFGSYPENTLLPP